MCRITPHSPILYIYIIKICKPTKTRIKMRLLIAMGNGLGNCALLQYSLQFTHKYPLKPKIFRIIRDGRTKIKNLTSLN